MTCRAEDRRWMATALSLGKRGLGRVWPNPAVGCVLVRNNRLIGRGWTQPGGRPHAEAMALEQAGDATGATAYVSLEPCAHHGLTPPCAAALGAAGISRVVAPMEDPDPRVAGKGFAALRAAGVAVEVGLMAEEATAANAGFLMRLRAGRPWITLKLAATLDGRIATATGESRWITGPAARARVHLMRAQHDGVLIGAGTARADNPRLDVRLPGMEDHCPVRIVIDTGLALDDASSLATTAGGPVWRLSNLDKTPEWGEAVSVRGGDGGLDLHDMVRALGARGLTRVLCEGGGRLGGALLKEGLVDEVVWMSAGAAIGADGAPSLGRLDITALSDAPRFAFAGSEQLGEDLLSIWRPYRQSDA